MVAVPVNVVMISRISCGLWLQSLQEDASLPASCTSLAGYCFWQTDVSYCRWVMLPVAFQFHLSDVRSATGTCSCMQRHPYRRMPTCTHLQSACHHPDTAVWLKIVWFQLPSDAEIPTTTAWPVLLLQLCLWKAIDSRFPVFKRSWQ